MDEAQVAAAGGCYPHAVEPAGSGAEDYAPTWGDLTDIQASRTNQVAGERATARVSHPFINDNVPVHNLTGRASAFTAANRWDPGTSLDNVSVGREPSAGITIKWNSNLAGSGLGARAVVNAGTGTARTRRSPTAPSRSTPRS